MTLVATFSVPSRTLLAALAGALLLASGCAEPARTTTPPANAAPDESSPPSETALSARDGEQVVRLRIEGMRCGGCVARAQEVLRGFDDVRTAEVSLETGLATVVAAEGADPARWIRALTEGSDSVGSKMGWTVSVVPDGADVASAVAATGETTRKEGCCGSCGGQRAASQPASQPADGYGGGRGEERSQNLAPTSGEQVFRIRIEGMRCGGCASRARSILEEFDEVSAADVNLESGVALVVAPRGADPSRWIEAIERSTRSNGEPTGWRARLVEGGAEDDNGR